MKLVFATGNVGKLREARGILGPSYEILSPADVGVLDEPEETGLTFAENSLIKAQHIYDATGLDCFADDSGLEVDALGGAPGIYSARYGGGTGHDFDLNMTKLLAELEKCGPDAPRTARFRCCVTLLLGGEHRFFDGTLEGKIAYERSGCQGFGYDPIFIPDVGDGRTMAELGNDFKNSVSHRAVALAQMVAWLNSGK